jgi:Arc/MetJ-type ribon-helix-helix transcriptional regulator
LPRKIEKEPTEGEYTTIKLPNDLVTSMDKLIGTYGFKSRAEIVKEALRELLTKYKPPLPRYDHFNMGVHGVRITDRQLHRIADIRFSPEGIYCELDESENCGHIEFALTVSEIKEIIRNKRKEGWKLPDI